MGRQTLPETEARRLLNGGIVTLVTTSWRGMENVAPVIWHTPLSTIPPMVGIAIHPSRHTHDMIKFSENFVLNIPTTQLMRHVQYAGIVSGGEVNKLEALRIPTLKARVVQAPLLDYCVGWIECGLEDAIRVGDHTFFIGKVVAVSVEEDAFDGLWTLDTPEQKPLHYIGGPFYAALGPRVEAVLEREEAEPGEEQGRFIPPASEDADEGEQGRES